MKVVGVLVLTLCVGASLAGRAFPVESEQLVQELFSSINPELEWDITNFLVDLSGRYSQCKYLGQTGPMAVTEKTPIGGSIGALIDYAAGSESYVDAVTKYLAAALPHWLERSEYTAQIKKATAFGCSVAPGCKDHIVIACLFTPEYRGGGPDDIIGGGGDQGDQGQGGQRALAFDPVEYELAEDVLGIKWDRSHLIENLSGFETSCAMVGKREWQFTMAKDMARERKIDVEGLFGYAENLGSTGQGIAEILNGWAKDYNMKGNRVGCSVIPDCVVDRRMYVVISCLFEM